jgi:uncharacterized protein (TIGR02246 family)
MRTGIYLCPLMLAACAPGARTRNDSAGAGTASPRASSWVADSGAIEAALASAAAGWNRGDLAAFLGSYVDSATIVMPAAPGQPPQIFRSAAASRPMYADMLKGPPSTLSGETLVLKPLGSDVAVQVLRYTLKQTGQPDATGTSQLVWTRTPAGWRIVADHTSG